MNKESIMVIRASKRRENVEALQKVLTEYGCSYAVKIRREKLWQAMDCLHRGGLTPLSVHEKQGDGYREVRV